MPDWKASPGSAGAEGDQEKTGTFDDAALVPDLGDPDGEATVTANANAKANTGAEAGSDSDSDDTTAQPRPPALPGPASAPGRPPAPPRVSVPGPPPPPPTPSRASVPGPPPPTRSSASNPGLRANAPAPPAPPISPMWDPVEPPIPSVPLPPAAGLTGPGPVGAGPAPSAGLGPAIPPIPLPVPPTAGLEKQGAPAFDEPPTVPKNQLHEQANSGLWVTNFHFRRSRTYAFVVDGMGRPIEIGSGRYARVFLGQEQWQESLTDMQRPVVIKMLHKNISPDDAGRFRMEKEILERVQGHQGIVELLGSGTCTDPRLPPAINAHCEGEFLILEKLDMSLEERLKGSRNMGAREDLLAHDMHDRLLRVLEYMLPIASAIEYAHLVKNVAHRDINPANILLRLPDPNLAGGAVQVRLGDFGVAKAADDQQQVTRFTYGVPGAMYFQSPEQEMNVLELLVSATEGSAEIEYFEDFYVNVAKNDTFAIFNRRERYPVLYTDRARRRIILATPYHEPSESNIRAHVQKSVGRPADIYSLGALLYYLISGAVANPKSLNDTFRKFVEYERADESNTIDAYLRHEYEVVDSIRSAKAQGTNDLALDDRFFAYKHYLDGNGELIHFAVMSIIAKAMMRNKPDSYCQAHDLETRGISLMVRDLTGLYSLYGLGGTVPPQVPIGGTAAHPPYPGSGGGVFKRIYSDLISAFGVKKR